jgi:hypothetical protein
MMMTGLNLDKREKADRNESNDETVHYSTIPRAWKSIHPSKRPPVNRVAF